MSRPAFERAAAEVVEALGPTRAKDLAGLLAQGRGPAYIVDALPGPAATPAVRALLAAAAAEGVSGAEAAAYLRGYAAGWARHRDESTVSTVWSGPRTPGTPSRATAQVLIEVVREAQSELIAMTYAAREYPPLSRAMAEAIARGVRVDMVVETKTGAAGLLGGPEPAEAFGAVPGVRLWHWPPAARGERGARLHAKIAVADRAVLLVGSANLTAAGARRNVEAGLLVRGGTAPGRAADHVRELQRRGELRRL
ncbi:DISARM system phospholipase D-like protein DrmC [Streptomyces harbinensis]